MMLNKPNSTSDAGDSHTQFVELPELTPEAPAGPALLAGGSGLLDGVKVSLSVVVGHAHTTLGELLALKQSALLKIDRAVDTPVDVMVDGNVVARGQLVVVDDNFGVRITDVAPALRG
ncbi:flagellar motor switch protein [Massilia violaceinigra]|uniref:Flagellar motor switch protein FliN n=1 Tax=Massilia violaceinigra TaxID=2045208 RepID=A0A2D2DH86_9BURK|nr:FliM/FliN family flagellar motor switch protein [Massilia violaceinigra]ATQ74329.1 flagellar motor switch protein [Massilia violaceinigra]